MHTCWHIRGPGLYKEESIAINIKTCTGYKMTFKLNV